MAVDRVVDNTEYNAILRSAYSEVSIGENAGFLLEFPVLRRYPYQLVVSCLWNPFRGSFCIMDVHPEAFPAEYGISYGQPELCNSIGSRDSFPS